MVHLQLTVEQQTDFTAWYQQEHPKIHRALRVIALDEHLASDATDEAFVRALERWSKVGSMDQRGAWVRKVAINLVRRNWRQRGRERRAYERHGMPEQSHVDDYLGELLSVMSCLTQRERTAIALRYVLGMTEPEVAEAMRVSAGTVATTLHRARHKLDSALAEPIRLPEEVSP